MVSALALELEVPESIPGLGKEISMSKHAFLLVICRDNTKTVRRPSDRPVNWRSLVQGKSAHVQVKESDGNSKWLLVGLHPVT